MKKYTGILLTALLTLGMLAGCGNNAAGNTDSSASASASSEASSSETVSEEASGEVSAEETDENEAAAEALLKDLTGSYQELWPVILDEAYTDTWISDCAELVGEENAEGAYEKLSSMVTGTVYGEEAVSAYKDGGGAYFCGFTEGLSTLTFDGENAVISGTDADGNELFSHSYHYIGMEEIRGLYEFESDDADAGEFTYFYLAPDTNDTTYHIEFRYGSDAEALGKYDAGAYAYWLASGISTECDEKMIENCIELFCTENLAG